MNNTNTNEDHLSHPAGTFIEALAKLGAVTAERDRLQAEMFDIHRVLPGFTAHIQDEFASVDVRDVPTSWEVAHLVKSRDGAIAKLRSLTARVTEVEKLRVTLEASAAETARSLAAADAFSASLVKQLKDQGASRLSESETNRHNYETIREQTLQLFDDPSQVNPHIHIMDHVRIGVGHALEIVKRITRERDEAREQERQARVRAADSETERHKAEQSAIGLGAQVGKLSSFAANLIEIIVGPGFYNPRQIAALTVYDPIVADLQHAATATKAELRRHEDIIRTHVGRAMAAVDHDTRSAVGLLADECITLRKSRDEVEKTNADAVSTIETLRGMVNVRDAISAKLRKALAAAVTIAENKAKSENEQPRVFATFGESADDGDRRRLRARHRSDAFQEMASELEAIAKMVGVGDPIASPPGS